MSKIRHPQSRIERLILGRSPYDEYTSPSLAIWHDPLSIPLRFYPIITHNQTRTRLCIAHS